MPGGLDPATIARLIARHGSVDAAAEKAKRDPRFEEDLRLLADTEQAFQVINDDWYRVNAEFYGLVAAWDRLVDEQVDGSGAFLPLALIERALRLHVRDGCGRRTLEQKFPGLTEWTAGQLLRWYRVGEPDGLWLDDRGRVQVGAKLAPTGDGVRLPRI